MLSDLLYGVSPGSYIMLLVRDDQAHITFIVASVSFPASICVQSYISDSAALMIR